MQKFHEELKERGLDRAIKAAYTLYLEHGIEGVTKEMIAKESSLAIRTVHRYFKDKTDSVLQVAEWLLLRIRQDTTEHFPESMFTDNTHTGAQLMELYMMHIKKIFMHEPRIFVLYAEFKAYIYRNCEENEQRYTLLVDWMGNRELRQKIYHLGIQDGSFSKDIDIHIEEEYFTESFFGFLANMAFSFKLHNREQIEKQIDQRIQNTIALYTSGKISSTYERA
jgi:AcrR family transcriptional regulator